MEAIIQRLIDYLENQPNFLVTLRSSGQFDRRSVDEFIGILKEIKEETSQTNSIDKRVPYLLLEVIPTLMSLTSAFKEKDRNILGKLNEEITEHMAEIFLAP